MTILVIGDVNGRFAGSKFLGFAATHLAPG